MSFRRALGPFDATMVVIGGIIGAGIFLSPGRVADRLDSPALVLGAWAAGGLIAMAGAFSYAELGGIFPKAGGQYVYLRDGLHPLMGAVQRLTQRAGAARAKEMALLGRRYPASVLERWNIVNFVVSDEKLDSATMVIAAELAHGPSIAHAATKRLVSVTVNQGLAAADDAMAEIQRPIMASADFRAAVRSYRENGIGMATFEGR